MVDNALGNGGGETMIELHSFGQPVQCKDCKQFVASVWSEMWLLAQGGEGRCDDCQKKHEAAGAQSAPVAAEIEPAEMPDLGDLIDGDQLR
jgi:hypothetical protein